MIAQVRASYQTPAALAAYRQRVDNGLRAWEETVVRAPDNQPAAIMATATIAAPIPTSCHARGRSRSSVIARITVTAG
jgi:hypothetical protein